MKHLPVSIAVCAISAICIQSLGSIPVYAAPDGIPINQTTFPDPNFRAVISTRTYDFDGNNYLSDYEIGRIYNIDCEGQDVRSLQGIEYFTSLQGLWCRNNSISSVDLSCNKDLRGIWCSDNDFTSLDFTENHELVWVYCQDNSITSLDFSNNPHLAYLECNTNPLSQLNLSQNSELEHLTCGTCRLSSLDLRPNPNLTHLDAFRNHMQSIDLSNNTKMVRLDIWDNEDLGNVSVSHMPGLEYYNCANNNVTSIDVSHNPHLQKLICSYNDIDTLNVSNNPELAYLDCACNEIDSLDLSNNPKLYFLQAFTNEFTTLNIGNNSRLIKTYNDGYCQAEYAVCIGHSWSIDYGGCTELGDELLYFFCVDDAVSVSTSGGSNNVPDSFINTNDGLSATSDMITREMAIETIYALAGSPSVNSGSTGFTDVPSGASYENAIKWGKANKICFGYPNICSDTFGVGEYITREDLAFMLHRFATYMEYKTGFDYGRTDGFSDFFDIDYYAWGAFTWTIQWEILLPRGTSADPKLYPHGRVTRSELESAIRTLYELNWETAPSTIPIPPSPQPRTGWVKDSNGWMYLEEDGTYPSSCWKKIDTKWYYFNADGYMTTGWQKIGSVWYYLDPSGAMTTGWKKVDGKWYYFKADGAMVTGWQKIDGKWYLFNSSGAMATGWQKLDGVWYYFKSDGIMSTGWVKVNGTWYYMSASGAMQTGWKKINGKWYYFYESGAMASNTTIDGYHLSESGAMDEEAVTEAAVNAEEPEEL